MTTPPISMSMKLYQERMQPEHRETRRQPGPHIDLAGNAAHRMEQRPPLPNIDVLHAEDDKPPAAAGTEVWPWGHVEEEIV